MSALTRFIHASCFLTRAMRLSTGASKLPAPERKSTASGIPYDLYTPEEARKTLVVVHGLTVQGECDPRLTAFCQALCGSGFRVAALAMSGLKSCRFEKRDVEAIVDLVQTLRPAARGNLGAVAFCVGAGFTLAAACDPRIVDAVDPIVLFGPFHSLGVTWRSLVSRYAGPLHDGAERPDHLWLLLTLALGRRKELGLSEAEVETLGQLLGVYCHTPDLGGMERFHQEHLKGREAILFDSLPPGDGSLEGFSAAGELKSLTSRVMMLHDSHDTLIGPEQTRLIFKELQSRGLPGRQRMLITPLLSHLYPRRAFRPMDFIKLLSILGEIFQ